MTIKNGIVSLFPSETLSNPRLYGKRGDLTFMKAKYLNSKLCSGEFIYPSKSLKLTLQQGMFECLKVFGSVENLSQINRELLGHLFSPHSVSYGYKTRERKCGMVGFSIFGEPAFFSEKKSPGIFYEIRRKG